MALPLHVLQTIVEWKADQDAAAAATPPPQKKKKKKKKKKMSAAAKCRKRWRKKINKAGHRVNKKAVVISHRLGRPIPEVKWERELLFTIKFANGSVVENDLCYRLDDISYNEADALRKWYWNSAQEQFKLLCLLGRRGNKKAHEKNENHRENVIQKFCAIGYIHIHCCILEYLRPEIPTPTINN